MKDEGFFKTIDMAFAAYLCCEGYLFIGAGQYPTEKYPNQVAFIFEDKDPKKRADLEERFRTGREDTVSAKKYAGMWRMVSRRAKDLRDELKDKK